MCTRKEYYKARGETLEVYTCECGRDGRYWDAGRWGRDGYPTSIGITMRTLRNYYTLITEKEAMKRVPELRKRLYPDD